MPTTAGKGADLTVGSDMHPRAASDETAAPAAAGAIWLSVVVRFAISAPLVIGLRLSANSHIFSLTSFDFR